MKFAIIAVVSSLAATIIAAQNPIPNQPNPPFFGGDKGKKDKSTTRPVHGVVNSAGSAVAQAIVELKNVRTGKKIGTVTRPDGTYRFDELNVKDDYELQASHDHLVSPVKKLSIYDSRKDPVINFDLEAKQDAQTAKQ